MFFKGKGPDPWTAWSPVHPLSSADSSDIERRKVTTAVSSPLKNSVGNSVDLGLGRAQHRGSSHTSHMGHPETTYKLLGFVQIFTSTNQFDTYKGKGKPLKSVINVTLWSDPPLQRYSIFCALEMSNTLMPKI